VFVHTHPMRDIKSHLWLWPPGHCNKAPDREECGRWACVLFGSSCVGHRLTVRAHT